MQPYVILLFLATILTVFVQVQAQSEELEYERVVRAPKPKFIRFGRGGGAKFIRFGRAGENTWDSSLQNLLSLNDNLSNEMQKRAGAKFIRFGRK